MRKQILGFLSVRFGFYWIRNLRMGQLCGKCVQFFCDCSLSVKAMSSDLMQDIRECLAQIHDCPCLKRRNFETRHLYKPDLLREEEIAQEFIQQVQRGFEMLPLGRASLEALKTLAFSENTSLQKSAALYYLHISQTRFLSFL